MMNKIVRIQDSDGTWVEDEVGIMEEIHVFYSRLFGVEREYRPNGREGYEILECLRRDIIDSMNDSLTREVTGSEVRSPVHQLRGQGHRDRTASHDPSSNGLGKS